MSWGVSHVGQRDVTRASRTAATLPRVPPSSLLAFAAVEADRSGEPLTAVSSWSPVALPLYVRSYPDDYLQIMQKLTEEALAISIAGIPQLYPDLDVRRVVERSDSPDTLINRLASQARLTVIGSHGYGRVARFLLGSTSQQVLARLATVQSCPELPGPPRTRPHSPLAKAASARQTPQGRLRETATQKAASPRQPFEEPSPVRLLKAAIPRPPPHSR